MALDVQGGVIKQARIALGGVANQAMEGPISEKALIGKTPEDPAYLEAAEAELKDAVPQKHNAFKIELCKRTIVRALQKVAARV